MPMLLCYILKTLHADDNTDNEDAVVTATFSLEKKTS